MICAASGACTDAPSAHRVTLFAAASTTDAVESVADQLSAAGLSELVLNLASSSVLARQIQAGAPADLFLSANADWMDELEDGGLIEPGSRASLLQNRLVVIVPRDSELRSADPRELPELLAGRRLAIGDPDSVPAGQYAAKALRSLGVFAALEPSFVPAKDVRAALTLVARGEVAAGIVYATDARVSDVRVIAELDAGSIEYPFAIVAGRRRPEVDAIATYLRGPDAAAVFSRLGFAVIEPTP